jgi:hypothetical protein
MADERTRQSNVQRVSMLVAFAVNVLLNLFYLVAYELCDHYEETKGDCRHQPNQTTGGLLFLVISWLMIVLEIVLALAYICVLFRIMRLLQVAYSELYQASKLKMFFLIVLLVAFLSFRVFVFYQFQFVDTDLKMVPKMTFCIEVSEIIFIVIASYVSYRNSGGEVDDLSDVQRALVDNNISPKQSPHRLIIDQKVARS